MRHPKAGLGATRWDNLRQRSQARNGDMRTYHVNLANPAAAPLPFPSTCVSPAGGILGGIPVLTRYLSGGLLHLAWLESMMFVTACALHW